MCKLKKIGLILVLGTCLGSVLVSCDDTKQQAEDVQKNISQGINGSEKEIKDTGEASESKNKNIQQFTNEEIGIDTSYIIKGLSQKGLDPKKIASTDEPYNKFFSVPQELFQVNGGYVSIYQYGIGEKQKMQNDYNTINEKGYIVNQNSGNWTLNFHLFKKGRVFVVYNGSDTTILNALNEIIGK